MYSRALVFAQFFLIGLMALFSRGIFSSCLGLGVLIVGVLIGLWAVMHNRVGNFNIRPDLKEGCALIMSGPYKHLRHPMYTSVMLITLGMAIATPTFLEWTAFIFLTAVLALKADREEKLWCEGNEAYADYSARTKRFIPFIY